MLKQLRIFPLKEVTPLNDGITHINIYSRGKTELGRYLSHFQFSPIDTEDGLFNSIEGYWYWLQSHDDELRTLHGVDAKKYGSSKRTFNKILEVPLLQEKILKATDLKITSAPKEITDLFISNQLPFIHAYMNGDDYSSQKSMDFVIQHLYRVRQRLVILGRT